MPLFHPQLLISAWSNRVFSDAFAALHWPASILVLNPDEQSRFQSGFFSAQAARQPWSGRETVLLGRSIVMELHSVAVRALANLIQQRTGRAPTGLRGRNYDPGNMDRHLAGWLDEVTSDKQYELHKQTPYLFTSGALRAKAIAASLKQVPHRPLENIIDLGSGVGMIPWLLQRDFPSFRSVQLIEPVQRREPAYRRLWSNFLGEHRMVHAKAEEAEYATADLIMFSHCLLLIEQEQRRAVLDRAWRSLLPGGVLLVNEAFRDRDTSNSARLDLLHRDELISLVPQCSQTYTRRTHWRKPQRLASVNPRSAGYTSIILAVKN